ANTSGLGDGARAPMVVFTGTDGVRVAYSTDGAKTFQAYDHGRKVITMPANSRDPKVFWHAPTRRWVLVVWSDAGGNAVHIYTSPDLLDWTFRSRYAADWLYECPDLFALPVDGAGPVKWVLNDASGNYVVGSFDGVRFTADSPGPRRMDHGDTGFTGSYYAGLTFSNMPDGRVVQMAWMPGNRGPTWTGSATVAVQLGLRRYGDELRVTRTPVAELATLRADTTTWTDRTVTPDAGDPLHGVRADTYELLAEFDTAGATAARFGFRLQARADGTYGRTVTYDRTAETLDGAPLAPDAGRVRMRILVDRGQLEVFGNEGDVSITRNVDFDPAATGLRAYAEGGGVRLVSLRLHRLRSAWGTGESTLDGNVAGPWRAAGGSWTDVADGKRGEAAGDGFYLSGQTGRDFSYEADVRLDTAAAAALTFRAGADAASHYTLNVDAAGLVKLWRPGHDIAVYRTAIHRGRFHHLRVVASGPRIRAYLDHGPEPVIDVEDHSYAEGRFGVNVFAGAAVVQNAQVDGAGWRNDVGGRWRGVTGAWTTTGSGVQGRRTGDGFYLSDRSGRDFSYEADLTVVAGRAAGLTFRASETGGHYTATIDTDGVVKLWRPGHDIATVATAIVPGRPYHVRVVAAGALIRVYLQRGATPVIEAIDDTYGEGVFGLNVFDGVARAQDVVLG
ncbi:MAG TPA: glycoside hydrolase family 32 protein, partial [Actinoplanes sp.]